MSVHNVFRGNRVHVVARMCSTCIGHDDNRMMLEDGRRDQMVADATRNDGTIVCHSTLDDPTTHAACAWSVANHAPPTMQLAARMGSVALDSPRRLRH